MPGTKFHMVLKHTSLQQLIDSNESEDMTNNGNNVGPFVVKANKD